MKKIRRASVMATVGLGVVLGLSSTSVGAAPVGGQRVAAIATHAVTMKKLSFVGTYSGAVKILWSATGASGTMTGTGKGTTLGSGSLSATGATTSFSTSSSSDPLTGSAVLKGSGGTITVKAVKVTASTTSSAAPTSSAPDPVTITGTVTVTKGTGKFVGATGTLSVHASFTVNTTTGSENQNFTASLKGSLSVKA
jgi:hypothetical protein